MRNVGGQLYLSNLSSQIQALLGKGHFDEEIGIDFIVESKSESIWATLIILNPDTCCSCEKRRFNECRCVAYVKIAA